MNNNARTAKSGNIVLVSGRGLADNDRPCVSAVGDAYRQRGNRSAQMMIRSTILPMVFSLILGSVPIAFAQMDGNLSKKIQLACVVSAPRGVAASRYVTTGEFTNQHVALCSVPAPTGAVETGVSYSRSPYEPTEEADLNQPNITSKVSLSDLTRTTPPPQGWQIGGGGILSYTAQNQRWHLAFGYKPDLGALRESFDHLHSFSLNWQYSFGKHKPPKWESALRPDPSPRAFQWPP